MTQVVVKDHGDVSYQEAAFRGNGQPVRFQADEPEGGELFQVGKFVFEIEVERNTKHAFVDLVIQGETAHQILDDIAAQKVVLIELVAAHDGQVSGIERGIVGVDVAFVLGVGAADFADGRYADGDQIAVRVGRVALEVALEEAFFEGDGKFVIGFGEMVHTDEDVAAFGQGLNAVLQHIEFFFAAGNGFGIDTALRLEDMRQVGIVIKGKAVGIERQDSVDGGFNAFGGLVRQTVNQIDADGFESGFAGGIDDFFGFVVALDAVDRCLHFGIKVLNADAHAVEAELAEHEDGFTADFSRVDFDGVFAAGDKLEMFAYHAEYAFDLVVAQESRRTAAEVQLRKLMPSTQMRGEQLHFFFKVFDVGIGAAFVFGDDFIAAAVVTDGVAEGDVDIKRKGLVQSPHTALIQGIDIFGFAKSVMKTVGCGVGSVARTAGRKAGDEFAVELRLVIVSIVIILYRYYFHGVCVIRVMKLGNFRIVW